MTILSAELLSQTNAWSGRHKLITNRSYVLATSLNGPFRPVCDWVRAEGGWRTYEFNSGHDVMIDMPQQTADILELAATVDARSGSAVPVPGHTGLIAA